MIWALLAFVAIATACIPLARIAAENTDTDRPFKAIVACGLFSTLAAIAIGGSLLL